jgi:ribosome-associated protein
MEEKIEQIVTWLADKKGTNIKALDVRGFHP